MGLFSRKNKEKESNTTAQIEAAKARVAAINSGSYDLDSKYADALSDDMYSIHPSSNIPRSPVSSGKPRDISYDLVKKDLFSRKYREIEAMRNEITANDFFKERGLDLNNDGKYTSEFYKKIDEQEKNIYFYHI